MQTPRPATHAGVNLDNAKKACAHALGKIKGVNWDHYRGHRSWEGDKSNMPDLLDRTLYEPFGGIRSKYNTECSALKVERVKCIGRMAEEKGVGNCGEFSSSAFAFLSGLVRPLELVLFPSGQGDHQFVLIGRDQSSSLQDHTKWGPNAVICDPWAQGFKNDPKMGAYEAKDFALKMTPLVGQNSSVLKLIVAEL